MMNTVPAKQSSTVSLYYSTEFHAEMRAFSVCIFPYVIEESRQRLALPHFFALVS